MCEATATVSLIARSHGFLTRSPHLKRRQKLASVNCNPSVGTGRGETLVFGQRESLNGAARGRGFRPDRGNCSQIQGICG
jgi:hypothetical protein